MKKVFVVIAISSLLLGISCTKKVNLKEEIAQLEKELYDTTNKKVDEKTALLLVDKYVAYADENKEDTLSPIYLFKGGEICMNIKRGEKAIELFTRVMEDYPNYNKLAETLFLLAFTYENVQNNIALAKEKYEQFLFKYPNHELVEQVELSLKHLGKTPEEIVEEFEANLANENEVVAEK
ncbi:MAG: tetratricopeptide repeat protein [Bacteroidales bacterium]|nr:tetratricopeptide repeat protein [Bacteroidales bacterium]MDY0217007.1 tetratricopeptide repeat protein [Bacteroidales bacterium]